MKTTELRQSPIAYHPVYRDVTGSLVASLMLSQLMYWHKKVNGRDFHKTDSEIMQETHLSEQEVKTAKKVLKKMPFIQIKLKGVPARTVYSIDQDRLNQLIQFGEINQAGLDESTEQDGIDQPDSVGEINQAITVEYTEDYTEEYLSIPREEIVEKIEVLVELKESVEQRKEEIQKVENCSVGVVTSKTQLTNDQLESDFAFALAADIFWMYLQQNEGQKQMMRETTRFAGTDDDLKELIHKYFADKADQNFILRTPCQRSNIGAITKWMSNQKTFTKPTKDPKIVQFAKKPTLQEQLKQDDHVIIDGIKVHRSTVERYQRKHNGSGSQ